MKKLIYILLFFGLFYGCDKRNSAPVEIRQKVDLPDQEIWNFKITATDKGKRQAVINAGHMRRFANRSLALFDEGVHIDFYDEQGKTASVLTAKGGELDENTTNVKVIGNVVVVSDSGFTLNTEELFYYKDRGRILSNVQVMVTTEQGDTLRGVGFESDTQMNGWSIKQPYDGVAHKSADLSLNRRSRLAAVDSSGAQTAAPVDSSATKR
jgi:LPS export ABC transporter protein LptC